MLPRGKIACYYLVINHSLGHKIDSIFNAITRLSCGDKGLCSSTYGVSQCYAALMNFPNNFVDWAHFSRHVIGKVVAEASKRACPLLIVLQ